MVCCQTQRTTDHQQNNGKRGKHSVYAHPTSPAEVNAIQAMERKRATIISENEMPTSTQRLFTSVMSLSDIMSTTPSIRLCDFPFAGIGQNKINQQIRLTYQRADF